MIARPVARRSSRRSSSRPARDDGVRVNAPVVTADGLVGTVTRVTGDAARVRLLTDESSAVSARRPADERVRHRRARRSPATRSSSTASRRRRSSTSATRSSPPAGAPGALASLYPKGIPIGLVTFVGQLDTDLYQQIQVESDVDFSVARLGARARAAAPVAGAAVSSSDSAGRRRARLRRRPAAGDAVRVARRRRRRRRRAPARRCSRSRCCAGRSSARSPASSAASLVDIAHARHARRHVAALRARRLLDRALRRDDRPRPGARAAACRPRRRRSRSRSSGSALHFLLGEAVSGAARALRDAAAERSRSTCSLTWPVFALCRRLLGRASASDRVDRGEAPWLARTPSAARPRGASSRPTRDVDEPYRFTPQLALRVGVLGGARARRLRDPLPPALGAAGALRRPLPERRAEQPAAHDPRRGAARLDRRPQRPHARLERARHGRADLAGRPAGGGPLRDVQAALEDPARAAAEADEGARGAQGRPADADPRQDGRARGPGRVPARSTGASSPASRSTSTYLRDYEHKALAAQVLGYVGEISPEELKQLEKSKDRDYPRRRQDRQDRGRGGVRHATCAARPATAQLRVDSLGRPLGRVRAAPAGAAGLQRPADDRRRPAAGRRARAPRRDRARARRTSSATRTAARSSRSTRATARSSRWRRTRPTSRPSTSAGSTRRSSSRSSPRRSRRSGTTRAQPRDRRRLSARLDVQAGDGARRDLGRAALAVRVHPVHAVRRRTGSTSRRSRTGTRTRTSR